MDGQTMTKAERRKARQRAKRQAKRAGKASTGVQRTPAQQFEFDVAAGRVQQHHLESRRYKATRRCCSSRWADDHWHGELHEGNARSWHTPVEYPPGGAATKMLRCRHCGRDTPPQCVVRHRGGQLCQDCAIAGARDANLSSHTVISEARMNWCNKRGQTYDGLY